MTKHIHNPSANKRLVGVFNIYEGGHGKKTAREGLLALGGFPLSDIGLPLNCIPLDENGNIATAYFGGLRLVETGLDGPLMVGVGDLAVFYITTFDSNADYQLSCTEGEIWRDGKTVYFRAPLQAGEVTLNVELREYKITIIDTSFKKPVITSPVSNEKVSSTSVTFTSSEGEILFNTGNELFKYADWEISRDPDFTKVYRSAYQTAQKNVWTANGLPVEVDLYVRVRYRGISRISGWSDGVKFRIELNKRIVTPTLISPETGAFGVSTTQVLQGSPYATEGYTGQHLQTDWIVAKNESFTELWVERLFDADNLTTLTVTLDPMTLYWVKFRYRDAERMSDWSTPAYFITNAD